MLCEIVRELSQKRQLFHHCLTLLIKRGRLPSCLGESLLAARLTWSLQQDTKRLGKTDP
jgi:hypothetical protein